MLKKIFQCIYLLVMASAIIVLIYFFIRMIIGYQGDSMAKLYMLVYGLLILWGLYRIYFIVKDLIAIFKKEKEDNNLQ